MKKLLIALCLLLCLLLVGCSSEEDVAATPEATAMPAATEAPAATDAPAQAAPVERPAVNTPITVEAYQKAYEALLTSIVPETTVSWHSSPTENSETWLGAINDSFVSVMLLTKDGMVNEVAVLTHADMSESSMTAFLSLAGYAGAALLHDEEVPAEEACDHFITELYTVFSAIIAGTQPESIYGLPGMINISLAEDGSYQYYFIMQIPQ